MIVPQYQQYSLYKLIPESAYSDIGQNEGIIGSRVVVRKEYLSSGLYQYSMGEAGKTLPKMGFKYLTVVTFRPETKLFFEKRGADITKISTINKFDCYFIKIPFSKLNKLRSMKSKL